MLNVVAKKTLSVCLVANENNSAIWNRLYTCKAKTHKTETQNPANELTRMANSPKLSETKSIPTSFRVQYIYIRPVLMDDGKVIAVF